MSKFSVDKYIAIAYGSPVGSVMLNMVEERWPEWLKIVDDAPWLRNWVKSDLYSKRVEDTPFEYQASGVYQDQHSAIANALFVEAVWGFGFIGWYDPDSSVDGVRLKIGPASRTIYSLQGLHAANPLRQFQWSPLYDEVLLPYEFGELNDWLEPIWVEALAAVAKTRVH